MELSYNEPLNKTILVVDDDSSIIGLALEAFKETQYHLLTTETGEKGLRSSRSSRAKSRF